MDAEDVVEDDVDDSITPASLVTGLTAPPPPLQLDSNGEFEAWLRSAVQVCPAYESHSSLLDECCSIVTKWRDRFWPHRALWARIRRGERLVKELCESAPVLARVRATAAALEADGGAKKKMVIIDLCSGFGYLSMFLSELLAPWADRIEKIVLVDVKWAPHNLASPTPKKHLDPEHIYAEGWPIRLTTCRSNLKNACARRQLAREFLSSGAPALLLGVHLCGTLSLQAISLYNDAPSALALALKPCCLPPKLHAKRDEVFVMGEHAFSACEVCADGRWRQGKWVGRANKQECQMRFGKWASHLHASVVVSGEEGGEKSLETHRVQASWWQNAFIFATRPHQPASPKGLLAASEPEREAARKEAAQRAEAVARILEEAKAAKAARRNASRNHGHGVAPADSWAWLSALHARRDVLVGAAVAAAAVAVVAAAVMPRVLKKPV